MSPLNRVNLIKLNPHLDVTKSGVRKLVLNIVCMCSILIKLTVTGS